MRRPSFRRNRGNRAASRLPSLTRSTASTVRSNSSTTSRKMVSRTSGSGCEPRELPRDVQVHQRERLLHLVDDEPEQARVAEHPAQQRLAAVTAHLHERRQPTPDAEPSRDEVAVLGPREHPRNRAQISERPRPEAPRRPGAEVQLGDLLERARHLVVRQQHRVLDEAPIRGHGRARDRLHGLVELAHRHERLFPLGLERCSSTEEASSSIWYAAVPRLPYLNDTTSPCSVMRRRPLIDPAGWAAMARPVGAPPRLTEPPRPWKKAMGTPSSRPSRVSFTCAL